MLHPLAIAFGFLTRVPLATGAAPPRDLGRAITWFPAVGAALGTVLVIAHHLAGGLATTVTAVILVALHAALTGGLHLDGVADVFDALGGGRGDRDRMLAILRDSRIGAHGAAALVLLVVAKVLAVAELLDRLRPARWALYAAPAAARWAVVPLIVGFPYARRDGLGKPFQSHAGAVQLAGATVVAAAALGWLGGRALVPALSAVLAAIAIAAWLHRRLGGLTGDVYGAAIEAAELAFLVVAGIQPR